MKPAQVHAQHTLARKSELFELGDLAAAPDDHAFLRRLNALVVMYRASPSTIKPPRTLAGAVLSTGRLNRDAELLAFGQWLITEDAPGMVKRGGRAAQPRIVLKALGAALAQVNRHHRALEGAISGEAVPDEPKLTTTTLATRWNRMFSEPVEPADMTSRMRSLKRYLPAYLDHIAAGGFQISGKTATRSPLIKRVLNSFHPKPSSRTTTKTSAKIRKAKAQVNMVAVTTTKTPIDAADLTSFDCKLRYSTPTVEEDYRQRVVGSLPLATLTYRTERYVAAAKAASAQASRGNHLLLAPDLDITRHFRVKALIDRMVMLLSTQAKTSGLNIHRVLVQECNFTGLVQDRTSVPVNTKDWRSKLPELDLTKPTGHHFAIVIQEPTQRSMKAALQAIDNLWTIVGPVEPFLCELAVDFFPDKDQKQTSPDERLILREQMVAALQRHHWCRAEKLESSAVAVPRYLDARQTYDTPGKKSETTRRFFPVKTGSSALSDTSVDDPNVRLRILSAKRSEALMLNAQIFRGAEAGEVLIRIQHKVTDKRNNAMQTVKILPEAERRARIEVEITGRKSLADLGLDVVEDLSRVQFRDLRKDLLEFRLPLVEAFKEELQMAKEQISVRGIYGWELWKQAQAEHMKDIARTTGRPPERTGRTKPKHLTAWMALNKDVGQALDNLEKRWKSFEWK